MQVTAGEITQADAARKWQVDVSTVIGIRRTVKDAAWRRWRESRAGRRRNAIGSSKRPATEIGQLTEAIKAQAIELAVIRGKSGWG